MRNGMPADELGLVAWRKSGRSNSTGNCLSISGYYFTNKHVTLFY